MDWHAELDQVLETHLHQLRDVARERRRQVTLRSVAVDSGDQKVGQDAQLGVWTSADNFQGDVNMRTIELLLKRVDALGFERSPNQIKFHDAFLRAAARVIYRADWETSKPAIMQNRGWTSACGQVMVSTPRRFGKTFRCVSALFFVSLSLSLSPTIRVCRPCTALQSLPHALH